ncbi:DUF4102 domain-containing protein [Rhizobium sp. WL3]|uniref:Arm DNA-binding domain-containing protein n=1 Tax=Rhizobium sp. WL3 TaxID=2603277 RepID=UPI0011C20B6D|nr:Arm DNA-binding domain-containing protein [Rhizobium sp. WL3]QEE44519.1 DUF4102 domain-containing protein [Rhizobium sp. WL3]
MRKKLTPKQLDNLSPAEDKRYEIRGELVRGLLIRVSRTGGKVWYLATRVDGVLRRIKLGTYPVLSLKDARERAQSSLRDIQLGTYQQRDVEPAPPVLTLGDVTIHHAIRPAADEGLEGHREHFVTNERPAPHADQCHQAWRREA